jgi:hypothetical protein
MYIAQFSSRNFDFTALGSSKKEAKEALVQGLKAHSADRSLNFDNDAWWRDDFSCNIHQVPVGGCLCDDRLISIPGCNKDGEFPHYTRDQWDALPADNMVYWPDNSDDPYSKSDFIRICDEREDLAYLLYDLCEWQAPETIIDEDSRQDPGDQVFALVHHATKPGRARAARAVKMKG